MLSRVNLPSVPAARPDDGSGPDVADSSRRVLDALPGRRTIADAVARLLGPGEEGVPRRAGVSRLRLRRRPGAEHPVLEVLDGPAPADPAVPSGPTDLAAPAAPADPSGHAGGGPRVLLDPLALDPSGATVLDGWWPGPEGRRVAVALSEPGHASRLRLLDVATGALLEGPLERTALSPVAWLPGEEELHWVRAERDGALGRRRVVRHRVGAPEAHDVPVGGPGLDPDGPEGDPGLYLGLRPAPDGGLLIIEGVAGAGPGNGLWLLDSADPDAAAVRLLAPDDRVRARARIGADARLWVVTTLDAPRGRVCVADPADAAPDRWRTVVGEVAGTVAVDARPVPAPGGTVLLVLRTRDGVAELDRHDPTTGARLGPVALPGAGTVTEIGEPDDAGVVGLGWTTTTTPPRVLHVDVATGAVDDPHAPVDDPHAPGPGGPTSRPLPGARILVTATRDPLAAVGPRPTVLTGYGGFGHVAGHRFSVLAAAWVAAGGVWARAVLRGGGEDGAPGHDAGRGAHLLAGSDDLLAAADALVAAGITTRGRLALIGTSHGGLRVGQALTARPAASAAAVLVSPVADLVRSGSLGLGAAWRAEYGDPADPADLAAQRRASPVHRVRAGVAYPRVLVSASDADTRVDPAHARALVDALAAATSSGPDAVLLRREHDTGHGARSTARVAAHAVDVLAFLHAALDPVAPERHHHVTPTA